jgi:hypothetical protein
MVHRVTTAVEWSTLVIDVLGLRGGGDEISSLRNAFS